MAPDGRVWRVGADGSVSGFPPGSTVSNGLLPAPFALIGEVKRQSAGKANESFVLPDGAAISTTASESGDRVGRPAVA